MEKSSFDRRILVIDVRMLTPDIDGASLRMYRLLSILRDLSCQVTFIASFVSSWPPYTHRLKEDAGHIKALGVEVPNGATCKSVEDYLQQRGRAYDIVILSTEYVATKHLSSVQKYAPQACIVFDTVDLHHLRYYREAKVTGNARALIRALQAKKRELAAADHADYTLVVSPDEKAVLEKECPGARIYMISNIHSMHGSAKPFTGRRDILFIGSLQFSANLDAIRYFTDEVYPLIRREITDIILYIIGHNPPDAIKKLSCRDIVITGYVPDLAPYLNNCRLSVAPLRFGAGVKGKVLTSISHGVPVVASSIAAEGLYLTDGKDVLVADTPDDFCKAVATLYQNEVIWSQISENGLSVISQHFSFAAIRTEVLDLLTSIERG